MRGAFIREGAIEKMEKVASSSQATGTRVYKTSGYEVCGVQCTAYSVHCKL